MIGIIEDTFAILQGKSLLPGYMLLAIYQVTRIADAHMDFGPYPWPIWECQAYGTTAVI